MRAWSTVAILTLTLALPATPSFACSIASLPDPRAQLDTAQGAFIGTLISKTEQRGPTFSSFAPTTMTFVVEWDVKGDLGRKIKIRTVAMSASCGIGDMVRPGQRVALIVHGARNNWSAGLGDIGDPEAMLQATKPLISVGGMATFFASVSDGGGRIVAIDRAGKVIAYGEAETFITFCPGNRRMVTGPTRVRDVRTFAAYTPAISLPVPERGWVVDEFSCRNESGSEILAFAHATSRKLGRASVFRIRGTKVEKLFDLRAAAGVFDAERDVLYFGGGLFGHEVSRLDLRSGARSVLARLDADVRSLSLSPSGRFIAIASHRNPFVEGESPSPIAIVEVSTGRTSRTSVRPHTAGQMLWLNDSTVVFAPEYFGWAETVRVYDAGLHEKGRISPWAYNETLLSGGRLIGYSFPNVVAAGLPGGAIKDLMKMDQTMGRLIPVPPGIGRISWPDPAPSGLHPKYLGAVRLIDRLRPKWPLVIGWIAASALLALVVFVLLRNAKREPPGQGGSHQPTP
jgi:hypothetical protein